MGSEHRDRQVRINVTDKARKETKQFTCSMHTLRGSMQYFEGVLDRMLRAEISASMVPLSLNVNCDLGIFAWLMDHTEGKQPTLDVNNVVSIILSSHFLKMESLYNTALQFVRTSLAQVLLTDVNMGCVPPNIATAISATMELVISRRCALRSR